MKTHPILNENIHPLAIEVCKILNSHNYQAFIVGGCVRDLLLGDIPKDWDITTSATPEEVIAIFPKTIPTGLQHGTVTVVMGEDVENHFEVTTFRVESKYLDGRRPESVSFVKDVKEDLARRDLTINAIAYDPVTNQIVDPFDGTVAIQHRMIEAVGDAQTRFQEDGLRIMRVARFAARFGWSITASTEEGMKNSLNTLKKISKERISDELSKTLMATYPSYGVQILVDCGALDIVCPLLAGRVLPYFSYPSSKENSKEFPIADLETRLAFLYNRIDVKLVEAELINLKFSTKEIKRTIFQLNLLEKFAEIESNSEWMFAAYKNFIAYIKNEAPDPYDYTLDQFIKLSESLGFSTSSTLESYASKGMVVYSRKELQINGNDIMGLGIKPGPALKLALDACYKEILRDPELNKKETLINYVIKNY